MAKIHTVSKENKALFPKSRVQKDDDDERMLKCAEEWISYYRANPHLYAEELEFGLLDWQNVILCGMFYNDYTLYDAARG